MPTNFQAAEEAIKKHEDFLTTTEASEEKITGVVEAGQRLINDSNANADKIQEKVDSIQERSELNWKIRENFRFFLKESLEHTVQMFSFLLFSSPGILKTNRLQMSFSQSLRITVSFSASFRMDKRYNV